MKRNRRKSKYIIGIDEVGRGALAGVVAVAAVALKTNSKLKLKDSKKLSRQQRERWSKYMIEELSLPYTISMVSPRVIDRINISQAANLAAGRTINKLTKKLKAKNKNLSVYLDGGLHLPKSLDSKFYILNSIIKGDEKISAIAAASIIAKVSRDKRLRKLHRKYPQYDLINNVGYGTRKHIMAVKKFGHSPIHRKSFKIK